MRKFESVDTHDDIAIDNSRNSSSIEGATMTTSSSNHPSSLPLSTLSRTFISEQKQVGDKQLSIPQVNSSFLNSLVLPVETTQTSHYAAFRSETPPLAPSSNNFTAPTFSPEKQKIFDGYQSQDIDDVDEKYYSIHDSSDISKESISKVRLTSNQIEAVKHLGKSQEILPSTGISSNKAASPDLADYDIGDNNTRFIFSSHATDNDVSSKIIPAHFRNLANLHETARSSETLMDDTLQETFGPTNDADSYQNGFGRQLATDEHLRLLILSRKTQICAKSEKEEDSWDRDMKSTFPQNTKYDLLSTNATITLYQGFRALNPILMNKKFSILPKQNSGISIHLGFTQPFSTSCLLNFENFFLPTLKYRNLNELKQPHTSDALLKSESFSNLKIDYPNENQGDMNYRKSSLSHPSNSVRFSSTELPCLNTMANISVLFSELIRSRDEALSKSKSLEFYRLLLTEELKYVEDMLTKLSNRKSLLKMALSTLVDHEDHIHSILETLESRITNISRSSLDFEKKVRSTKADSERLQESIDLLQMKEEYQPFACIKTLFGHGDSVECIDMDMPFGTAITGSVDKTFRVWDLSTMRCQAEVAAHTGWIRCLQLKEKTLMTGSGDHLIKHWNLSLLPSLPSCTSLPPSEPLNKYSRFEKFQGEKEKINEDEDEKSDPTYLLSQEYVGHQGAVTCLMFDSCRLLSGSTDKTIRQWDIETGECVSILRSEKRVDDELSPPMNNISGMRSFNQATEFSSIWNQDFFGCYKERSNNVPFWASANVQCTYSSSESFKVYHVGGSVGALQFRGHGLAAGYGDGIVRLWDLRTGRCHRTLEGHLAAVTCLGFDDLHVFTGSTDKTVKVWDLRNGNVQSEIIFLHGVTSLDFDSRRIVATAGTREVQVYIRASGSTKALKEAHTKPARCVSYCEDWCVSGGMDGLVNVWKL